MFVKKRFKTNYAGVYYIKGNAVRSGKKERIYYIIYRKGGKQIEEAVGCQFQDKMTPARASQIRIELIAGNPQSRKGKKIIKFEEEPCHEVVWEKMRIAIDLRKYGSFSWSLPQTDLPCTTKNSM